MTAPQDYFQLQQQLADALRINSALRDALEGIRDQCAGYGWGYFGNYRGKTIVVSEDRLNAIDALLSPPSPMPAAQVWLPMDTAPKNASWVTLLVRDQAGIRHEVRAHYAEDLSGEDQPPFRGWFREVGGGISGFTEVSGDPVGWQSVPAAQEVENGTV